MASASARELEDLGDRAGDGERSRRERGSPTTHYSTLAESRQAPIGNDTDPLSPPRRPREPDERPPRSDARRPNGLANL